MFKQAASPILFYTIASISLAGFVLLGYATDRANFLQLIALFGILFGAYYYLIGANHHDDFFKHSIIVAVLFRLSLLFMHPNLSDDFYRFIWDGRLIEKGMNPYSYLPNQITKEQMLVGASNLELFQKMNSPNYYSVYPPVLQFLFFISAKLSFGYHTVAVYILRVFVLLAELGTFIYLTKILDFLKIERAKIFLYLLNPLIILELTGNLHFEAVMIFFLTASFYYLLVSKYVFSAVFIALAISTKVIPLLFLPLIIKKIGWKNGIIYAAFSLGIIILLFLPFIDQQLISNVGDSVSLYFQKFEFNASIYYLLREIGYKIVGYNAIGFIGKVLPIISTCLILFISFRGKGQFSWQVFFNRALNILFVYYLLSLVVHPWYVSLLVLISVFVENRFAILWSLLIFGSYFAYNSIPFEESFWVNVVEYSVVIIFFIYENKKLKAMKVFN